VIFILMRDVFHGKGLEESVGSWVRAGVEGKFNDKRRRNRLFAHE